MRLITVTITILTVLFIANLPYADKNPTDNRIVAKLDTDETKEDVRKDINPHFSGEHCDFCHEKRPEKGGETYLKYEGDFIKMCDCHKYTAGTYIHPVFIEPSNEKKSKIPEDFPLKDGKITCSTCHEFYDQCQENRELRRLSRINKKHYRMDRMFLRGAPFRKRTDICFKCHDESKYKMMDPHNQLDANGEIVVEKCLYCHKEKPDADLATYADVELIGDLKVLCQRCHGFLSKHPANVNHFRQPSEKMFTRMKIIEGEYGIVLPLDYEGKLTCITCHNPHERGVIPSEREGAKGSSEKYRHRLPGILCQSCHRM